MAKIYFGKYSGREIKDIPLYYVKWLLSKNIKFDSVQLDELKSRIDAEENLGVFDENQNIKFGMYKGKKLEEVPTSYLRWAFNQGLTDPFGKILIAEFIKRIKKPQDVVCGDK